MMTMLSVVAMAEVKPAEAMQWWEQYRDAMVRGDGIALTGLLAEQARITVRVHEPDIPVQSFSLTPTRFTQQQVMMTRFASRQQRQTSAPILKPQSDGSMLLELEMTERRQLFGVDQQQHDQLQIRLTRQQSGIRAEQVVTDTRIR